MCHGVHCLCLCQPSNGCPPSPPPLLPSRLCMHTMAQVITRDLPGLAAVDVTRVVRQREESLARDGGVPTPRRLPIIVMSVGTDTSDLRSFMQAGLDGCVSLPVDTVALVNTVCTAVPNAASLPPRAAAAVPAEAGGRGAGGWDGPSKASPVVPSRTLELSKPSGALARALRSGWGGTCTHIHTHTHTHRRRDGCPAERHWRR